MYLTRLRVSPFTNAQARTRCTRWWLAGCTPSATARRGEHLWQNQTILRVLPVDSAIVERYCGVSNSLTHIVPGRLGGEEILYLICPCTGREFVKLLVCGWVVAIQYSRFLHGEMEASVGDGDDVISSLAAQRKVKQMFVIHGRHSLVGTSHWERTEKCTFSEVAPLWWKYLPFRPQS